MSTAGALPPSDGPPAPAASSDSGSEGDPQHTSNTLDRLLAEIVRRKVHRVAAIYIAVGIPVLEAADLLSPVLLLPEWVYRATGFVVLLGFPIAFVASWTFDATRSGIERTEPVAPLDPGPPTDPEAITPWVPPRASTRLKVMMGVLALTSVMLGGLGWRLAAPQSAELDERTIAILPFRISADRSLDYLGEGLMDLLTAQLPGDVGPRALDPGVVLNRVAEWEGTDRAALPRRDAIEVARDLGASGVLLGTLVGSAERIFVDATLFDAGSGREVARLRADAPEDSLRPLADRLTLELLAQTADAEPRLASQLTDSLDALRAYLRGVALSRQGQFFPAMDELERALEIDSTFAKAAIAFGGVACWTFECGRASADRAGRLAWEHRDRLSSYDRLWLEADRGVSSPRERLAVRQRLAETRPDETAAWDRLAWSTYQWGAMFEIEDTEELAARYLYRSLDLGGQLGGKVLNAGLIVYSVGDTANLRRVSQEFLAGAPTGASADWVRWVLATATGDTVTVADVRSRMSEMTAETVTRFLRFASLTGHGVESADSAAAEIRRRIQRLSAPDFSSGAIELQIYEMNRGWPRAAGRTREMWAPGRPEITVSSWLWGGWEAEDLGRALDALAHHGTDTSEVPARAGEEIRAYYRCLVGLARIRRRSLILQPTDASAPDALLADPRNTNRAYYGRTAEMCETVLDAWQALSEGRPDAAELVAKADSIQLAGHNMFPPMQYAAPIEIAWLKERLGDLPGALRAMRRQVRGSFVILFTATRVREEGRLAALNGDIEGAIRAYEHYLALRSDPEPELEPEVADVRAEYERLVALAREP